MTKTRSSGSRGLIALDADGVLLDYNLAYAHAWEKAFGKFPVERDPLAYWAMDRWDVPRLEGEALEHFRNVFDGPFWSSIPLMPGADTACKMLVENGYELVCVTALADEFHSARARNLKNQELPISEVHLVRHGEGAVSPKAQLLFGLRPEAFVDDYLPYLKGVDASIHRALIVREPNGSPNRDYPVDLVSSEHHDLLDFAKWWVSKSSAASASSPHGPGDLEGGAPLQED
jgi:hypothetical protein